MALSDQSPLRSSTPAPSRRAPEHVGVGAVRDEAWGGVDIAWRVTSEFLTATLFWGGVGWLCDRWLGTAPWLMVLGFVIGNATGLYLLYLRSQPESPERDSRT